MDSQVAAWRINGDHAVLLVLLGGSLALNLYLGTRLVARSRVPVATSTLLNTGDRLGDINVRTLGGDEETLRFGPGRHTLLYVFRPSCPWCEANAEAGEALYEQTKDAHRFVALSI